MTSVKKTRDAVLACLLLAPLAHGASAADPADESVSREEVVVEATRAKLNELRLEMVRLEDRFYERYNELNGNDDFDVHCRREARVGTRLERRYCVAVYERKAYENEGREGAVNLQRLLDQSSPMPQGSVSPPIPAIAAIEARREDFRKNMRDVVSRNPELIELLRERAELGQRFEAMRRRLFGREPPREDEDAAPAASSIPCSQCARAHTIAARPAAVALHDTYTKGRRVT